MNDVNEFIKRYDTKADCLSALFQLWNMPGMVERMVMLGGFRYGEKGIFQQAFVYDGIEEAAFCAFFHAAPLKEIRLTQCYKNSQDMFHITAFLQQNLIYVGSPNREDWTLLLEIQEKMEQFHQAPAYPKNCNWTFDFSHTLTDMTPKQAMAMLIQRLQSSPVMNQKIMVVDEGTALYHPLEQNKTADWLYAYDKETQQLMIYNTLDDVLVAANL